MLRPKTLRSSLTPTLMESSHLSLHNISHHSLPPPYSVSRLPSGLCSSIPPANSLHSCPPKTVHLESEDSFKNVSQMILLPGSQTEWLPITLRIKLTSLYSMAYKTLDSLTQGYLCHHFSPLSLIQISAATAASLQTLNMPSTTYS